MRGPLEGFVAKHTAKKHASKKHSKKKTKKVEREAAAEFERVFTRLEDEVSDHLDVIITAARDDAADAADAIRGLQLLVQTDMNDARLDASNSRSHLREQLEQTDRHSQKVAADLDGLLATVQADAEARIDGVGSRVEEHAIACEQAIEVAHLEAGRRIAESQRLVDERSEAFLRTLDEMSTLATVQADAESRIDGVGSRVEDAHDRL